MKDIIDRLRVLTEDTDNLFEELTSELTSNFREYVLENVAELPEADNVELIKDTIFEDWYQEFNFISWFTNKFDDISDAVKFIIATPELTRISDFADLTMWDEGDNIFLVIIHNAVGVFQEWANENLPKLVESWINDLNTLDNEMEKE